MMFVKVKYFELLEYSVRKEVLLFRFKDKKRFVIRKKTTVPGPMCSFLVSNLILFLLYGSAAFCLEEYLEKYVLL